MADPDLDRLDADRLGERLGRIGAAAARTTSPRDPGATERRGRRRRTARRAGAGLALAGLVGVLALGRTVLPSWDDDRQPIVAQPSPSSTTIGGPELAAGGLTDGLPEGFAGPVRQVAHGGLVFDVPLEWVPGVGSLCPGIDQPEVVVDPYPVPPPALDETAYESIGCAPAKHPFAQLRSVPDTSLPGAAERTVAGRRVLVLDAGVQPPEAPGGWTVRTALFPVPGGGVLLQVDDPGGPDQFERIIASVRTGSDGGNPLGTRVAWNGASFEVPDDWEVIEPGDACGTAPRRGAVYLGRTAAGCEVPATWLEVTAAPSAPAAAVRLNGLDLELGAGSQGGRTERTATLAGPLLRLRQVSTAGDQRTPGVLDAVLLSLRRE
jgi:hypothetical protein